MYLEKLLNLSPMFEEDGGGTGTVEDGFLNALDGDSEPEQETEPTEEEAEDVETKPEAETIPPKFKVKHNNQELEIEYEKAPEYIQKGLDYDRLRESRDRYMAPIERLAKQSGLATDQFLVALDGMIKTNAVEAKTVDIKNYYASQGVEIDDTAVQQMAEMAYENDLLKNGQIAQNDKTRAQQELQNRIQKDISDFEAEYPEVKQLPDEVTAAIKQGISPLIAYQKYFIREQDKKLKAVEQDQKNKQITGGSAKTIGTDKSDPFLEAFLK
jgi:hypothetical protein